jgi:2,3-bisphosphoglycerate-independent phosphoglycerate mutase
VSADDVFAYAALRPAERRADGWWLTGRPDPVRDAGEAERLVQSCDRIEFEGLMFSLTHVWRGEAVLRISGGADDRVTDTDAFFRAWYPVLRPQAVVPKAERTAHACEQWTREVMRRLEGERFNVITLKWFGRPKSVPSFLERHGVTGTFAAESAFLRGLGRCVGLESVENPHIDVGLAHERLDAGDMFVYVHDKRIDQAGHTKDPNVKREAVELLDAAFTDLPTDRAIVCVTGDHATPATPDVIHSGDPVPFVIAGPGVRADRVREFGESSCADGILGQLRGPDMMPVLLNAADRPLFLGSRPTPFDGADGYPAILEPLL